jgi:hypothetical protein
MNKKNTKTALRMGAILVAGLVIGAAIHKLVICLIIGIVIGGVAIMISKIRAGSTEKTNS